MLTRAEVQKHASRDSCWLIIQGNVYDLTTFLDEHPGGPAILRRYAGADATDAFDAVHAISIIEETLQPENNLGAVHEQDAAAGKRQNPLYESAGAVVVPSRQRFSRQRFRLGAVLNMRDFERAACANLSKEAFAFFKAGADDENTVQWNEQSWRNVRFRPRILRPIRSINLSTSVMGSDFALPFFICPAGGGKLAHREGEVLMTKAAGKRSALHFVCNMASCTKEEIAEARAPAQTTYWQIYAMNDLAKTEREIKEAVDLGYKGFALTVDAIRAGKRERDMRVGLEEMQLFQDSKDEESETVKVGGVSASRAPVWSAFDWPTAIAWIRSLTSLPLAIKGIQCWEDAALCMEYGVHPWLSNHGGRQLEGAPSAVETLIEMRQQCPEVFDKCDVIVDGGIRRGTDIVKALALGAKVVGLGRPFLYALSFGEAGVSRAFNILMQEMETAMALLGVEDVKQLGPQHVERSAFSTANVSRARL